MHLVRLTLAGPATEAQADVILDALWAHLPEGHGVEHMTATPGPSGIDLAIFLRQDITDPQHYARVLIETVRRTCPALQGRHLAS
jgi:hypothetical protein